MMPRFGRLADSKALSLMNKQLLERKSRPTPSRGFLRRLFERFTEEAMKAIIFSKDETRRRYHVRFGTDKILIGLLHAPKNSIAAKVLEFMGIDPKDVSVEADKIARRPAYVGMGREVEKTFAINTIDFPSNDYTLHTLELSYQEARKLGHNYIGSGHLLLGLVSDEGCLASLVLAKLDANTSNIREEVLHMFGENNNEIILEMTSYQPTVEDVAKVHFIIVNAFPLYITR
ncbi:ATP-dependent Clp protease ATP-binding subunit ClpA-like protein [Cardamine amara subsp. amara]|uniref:ATP-dependent Clp protease ATP-binding subunit ClpA-like protein n=1 Tax=Cardamine amara subsp. amara TaxID=228776 RepID=A0ABD1B378_CARAN